MLPFGERVRAAVKSTGPLCVGIDPSASLLAAWGLPDDAEGLRAFGTKCVEALQGVAAVVKPQVAFFERHGARGMAAFEEVVAAGRDAGILVIADAKRGDIGTTSAAYADAWFRGPLSADALTSTPYLGIEALAPMGSAARGSGKGLIVVVSSSNPEGRVLQEAVTADGRTVERVLFDTIAAWNAAELASITGEEAGAEIGGEQEPAEGTWPSAGTVGAVVGAVRGGGPVEGLAHLGGVILAPGLGAQGASVDDVARRFGDCVPGTVLPSVSRSLLSEGERGLREAALRVRDELAGVLA